MKGWTVSECLSCEQSALWLAESMIYPISLFGPTPNTDMPAEITSLFHEARSISQASPRAAAGLLRLALQMLVDQLQEGPGSIHEKIGSLVTRGMSPLVQQAMDTVRVIGNNALHPGEIELHDDPRQLSTLFDLVNLIVQQMITQPRLVGEMYKKLPSGPVEAIHRRDGGNAK